ncbi:MAG TPA: branched-chain amino acid ABC transporter substrate-binding protein [Anaerolineales bacterium]|nr:branched-chain amino acid ABC transporter substrate-binding protein [Anaerolineales bacterium]
MRKFLFQGAVFLIAGSLLLAGRGIQTYNCTDKLGCVAVPEGAPIQIGSLLTLSGPDADLVEARGVEIAVADKGKLLDHPIELIQQDDLCDEDGGRDGATRLAAIEQIVGVIGTACSGSSVPAAKILSDKGMVLISPSSTAPSLTDPATHQPGFLRTIYNDKAQGQAVAKFAFNVLGARRMVTFHDGTPYPQQLQEAACQSFIQLGGECVQQIQLSSGQDINAILESFVGQKPDVLYFPVYTEDGVAITKGVVTAGLSSIALISSDALMTSDFLQETNPVSEGMYLSGPAEVTEPQAFVASYKAHYTDDPADPYHLQAYDATILLFNAIEKVGVTSNKTLYIPRQALRDALYATRGMQGLSGPIDCSPSGDCAQPNIEIFQIVNNNFKAIYP